MLKIGLTGNIGSGKSTVAKVFELLGITVFYADEEAKKVMVKDVALIDAIKQNFGSASYLTDGSLNRKHIAGIVFNNSTELQKLNNLVHPAVFRAFETLESQVKNAPYIIREAAILFESGSYKTCDRTLMITAPLEDRISRVMRRDDISRAEVEKREARQMPEEEKKKLASDIIINDDRHLIISKVLQLHNNYLALSKI